MRYIILISLLLTASCGTMSSTRTPDPAEGLKDLLSETNPETGKPYTLLQAKELKQAAADVNESKGFMDRLLSTPIMILFVLTAIGMSIGAAVSFYRGNIASAIACAVGAIGVLILPILIIVMFKALMFLLYIFYAVVIIGIGGAIYFIYDRMHKGDRANEVLVGSIQEIKQQLDPDALIQLATNLKEQQDDTTKKVVKKIRKKK